MLELELVKKLTDLYRKHISEGLSESEKLMLDEMLADMPQVQSLFVEAASEEIFLYQLFAYYEQAEEISDEYVQMQFEKSLLEFRVIEIKTNRRKWLRYAVAASLLFVMATGMYFWLGKGNGNQIITNTRQLDIPPGKDGAILTLASGEQIELDNAGNGSVAQQGASQVKKEGSVLAYNANGDQVVYNRLSTPRGRQFQLALPDGSKIWLNAASSVRFPTAFPGKERKIEITGECYMEIAKDISKPFIVSVIGIEVEVLGTSFNINSYPEESSVNTTLLEGKVRIRKGAKTAMMNPGQQAQVRGETISLVENANVETAIAWKKGLIALSGTDIKYLLSSISRWYDVEVEVKGNIQSDVFYGSIPRSLSLQEVAKALGNITNLKFTIEGKKMIVSE